MHKGGAVALCLAAPDCKQPVPGSVSGSRNCSIFAQQEATQPRE